MAIGTTGAFTGDAVNGGISLTYSYTTAGDADYLVVAVKIVENGTENTSVTYNTVPMTKVAFLQHPGAPTQWGYLFGLKAPATGAHDIVITAQNASDQISSCAQGFKGVDQTTPTGATNTSSCGGGSTSIALSLSSAAGRLCVDTLGIGNNTTPGEVVSNGDETIIGYEYEDFYVDMATAPGAGTVNFSRTWTAGDFGQDIGMELLPAGNDYTLSSDAGSFVLAGASATSARSAPSDAGALVMSGQAAGLLYHRVLGGDAGAFTLSGQTADFSYVPAFTYTLVADAGGFTTTGVDSAWTFSGGPTPTAAGGSFVFTGQEARFREHRLRYRNIYFPNRPPGPKRRRG